MASKPVVFIHGLWLHATSWKPWIELFRVAGTAPSRRAGPARPTPSRRRENNPDAVANIGIDEVTGHYAGHHRRARRAAGHHRPLVRGLFAEKLLGQGVGARRGGHRPRADQGCAPAPAGPAAAGLPALGNPANLHRSVSLTQKEFRFGFGNAVSEEESDELYERVDDPLARRPLFQAAAANFVMHSQAKVDTDNETRGPLLLISGTADHTVPDVVTRSTLKQYRDSTAVTELKQFEGRGHSLTIDSGWQEVADAILELAQDQRALGREPKAQFRPRQVRQPWLAGEGRGGSVRQEAEWRISSHAPFRADEEVPRRASATAWRRWLWSLGCC